MRKLPLNLYLIALGFILMSGCSVTPQQPAPSPQPAADQQQLSYQVKKGDTLYAIARKFAVTPSRLQQLNRLVDPHQLRVGMRLIIPAGAKGSFPYPGGQSFIWPLATLDISSKFGARGDRHRGIDLRAPRGANIYAAADGEVHFAGRQRGYGKVIILQHANGIKTLYAHNHANLVKKGEKIKQGMIIGSVGNSGNATGYHLHFEYIRDGRPLDPLDHIGSNRYAANQ